MTQEDHHHDKERTPRPEETGHEIAEPAQEDAEGEDPGEGGETEEEMKQSSSMTGACKAVRNAVWVTPAFTLLCCLGNYTMNTIFANVLLVGFGGVVSCIGLLVATIGLVVWRGSAWTWPIVGNIAALSLVIWMFAVGQVPMGYGP